MFFACTVVSDGKETELESSDQEASPSVGSFSVIFAHGSAFLQLFLVVWIFLRFQGVICYNRRVVSEGFKNYFNNWCLMTSQPTFLFLTYLNLMNYGHLIKSM